jgi:PAS domain S-box-containing protein
MADKGPSTVSKKDPEVVINAARSRDDGEHAVIATDAGGQILYWNAAAALLYGWSAEEVLGHNILDITPTRRSGDAAEEIMENMRSGNEWAGEFIVKHRDGSPMVAWVRNSIVRVDDVVVGVVGVSLRSPR